MALVDSASSDLTLEIVRGAENKNTEEKENVAPNEVPHLSEREKQEEVSQSQQVVTELSSIQVQQSLPVQQLPSPFQQPSVEQIVLSKPSVVSTESAEEQVSITVKLGKQKQPKAVAQEEVQQTITKTESTVTETHSTIKLSQGQVLPEVKTVTEVKETKTELLSQKTGQISDITSEIPSQVAENTLSTVISHKVSVSEAQSDQIPVESNLAIPSQLESVQEAVSVSEISEVQEAPVISRQITVHNGPSTVETSQPVINHVLIDKNIAVQEITATISESSQVICTEVKEQQILQTSGAKSESKTSVTSSEKLITETHSPSVQEILSEVQQVLSVAEQEKINLLESKQPTPEDQTVETVSPTSVKVVEAIVVQPITQSNVQPVLEENAIKGEEIVRKEKVSLSTTDKVLISEVSQTSSPQIKPSIVQASGITETACEIIQGSLEKSKPLNITFETSIDQTATLVPIVQDTTSLVSQTKEHPQEALPLEKEQVGQIQEVVTQSQNISEQKEEQPILQEHSQERLQTVNQTQEAEALQKQSLVQKQEPVSLKKESVPQKEEILVEKQVPLLQTQEPLIEKQEPIVQKPEVVLPKQETVSQISKTDISPQKLPSPQVPLPQAPVQQSSSPFQQIPIQQTPVPQQALVTNMGQGESKKESKPSSEVVIVSQEPQRPLPQLENIPPVPAHLLKSYEEPPQKVLAKLPNTSTLPSHIILDTSPSHIPKQMPQEQIQSTIPSTASEQPKIIPLPSHIQNNIPEIPKHLLESDNQPALHAKALKEIHEKEIQRVAQEKTAYDSTAKMLQEFEELKSMQKRGEINEPTAFTIRQQNEVPFSSSLVNGHVQASNSMLPSTYYSPTQQIQEYISPDNSTRRWITREKKEEGPRQEEKFTETVQYQKGNVQVSQTTSQYTMSESHQYPPTSQRSQPKSVVWPPPPSSPSRNSPYMFQQQPETASSPLIKDYIWQPPTQTTPASVGLSDSFSSSTGMQTGSFMSTNDPEKILQEPHESVSALKKRFENQDFRDDEKIYSSSSFFAEPGEIYPTMEEQIQSARKIADSLSADANLKSRGATMFYKRKTKSSTWGHGTGADDNEKMDEYSEIRTSEGTSPLKLFLDPRSVKDAQSLRNTQDTVYHNIVSPDVCHDLVKDLNSPGGKGASMFAKRRQKSEDWIIDEKNVKALPPVTRPPMPSTATPLSQQTQQTTPDKIISDLIQNPRIKIVKSPWQAALQSPIGSCDAAFEEYGLRPIGTAGTVVDTIREAAEKRELPGPPDSWKTTSTSKFSYVPPPITPSVPRPLPKFSGEPSILASEDIPVFKTRFDARTSSRPFSPTMDTPNYNRSARGWTPVRSYENQEPSGYKSPLPTVTSESIKPVFKDYNIKPRKWISSDETQCSLDVAQIESRALSPGRQLSNYNSLPRSFGGSTRTQPGKLPANIWPRETKDDYSSGFSYQAPKSQFEGYGEEAGFTDL